MLIPPTHFATPLRLQLSYLSGILLLVAGICIVINKKTEIASLILGVILLLVFCFYFIPYMFMSNTYMHFGEWENAEKELALSGGAFILAGYFSQKNENPLTGFLTKLIFLGPILFSVPIICFGIAHFLGPQDVADYTPSWVPFKMFWAYFCGAALIGSGIAIIFKIKPALSAVLLGTMIFLWFILLHIPRVIASPVDYLGGEITSAAIALAYSGIAFVISRSPRGN